MAFNVHAGDEAVLAKVAAEEEVVVAGMRDGIGVARGSRSLVRPTIVTTAIIDAAVDQSLDAHPVSPALHVGDRAHFPRIADIQDTALTVYRGTTPSVASLLYVMVEDIRPRE